MNFLHGVLRAGLIALLLLPLASTSREAKPRPPQAAIASANAQATDIGMRILAQGGNAFDAAVAVSAALGLVEPESSGIGGGGFFLIQTADGREVFIDARETAPSAAHRDMYLDGNGEPRPRSSVDGALAAGIPGLPAAWAHVSKKYGRLPLRKTLAPVSALAREGWVFGRKNTAMMRGREPALIADVDAAALLLRDGKIPAEGTRMLNPDYAATVELIARSGARDFYSGGFASRMVENVRAKGGIWRLQDLANYRVIERAPLKFSYRGYEVLTAPPPSSGGVAIAQVMNILDGDDLAKLPRVDRVHLLTEAMRRAYRDRAAHLGDPDFVKVPLRLLMSRDYAEGLRVGISMKRATPSDELPSIFTRGERTETTHFSIIDREGNRVAVTQTVNLPYGNAVVLPGTGFLLNNEMDDFSIKPGVPNAFGLVGDEANAIAPGKRPLSSMSPTILSSHDRVVILGTPGGSRIISMVLLGSLAAIEGQGAQAIADLPRIHHQYLPDTLYAEKGALDSEEVEALKTRGHQVSIGERTWGNMQVVVWDRALHRVEAGSDGRWKGVGKGSTDASIYR